MVIRAVPPGSPRPATTGVGDSVVVGVVIVAVAGAAVSIVTVCRTGADVNPVGLAANASSSYVTSANVVSTPLSGVVRPSSTCHMPSVPTTVR